MIEEFQSSLIEPFIPAVEFLFRYAASLWNQLLAVLRYPVTPTTRLHYLFLASSLLFAWIVFSRSRTRAGGESFRVLPAFARFLFPSSIWKDSSAWLDVRYFLVHMTLWVSAYGSLSLVVKQWVANHSLTLLASPGGTGPLFLTQNRFLGGIAYMFLMVVLADFLAYVIHYMQHRVPFLWEFHKVHHSATVMHPLTNYREHPVDNLLYNVGTSMLGGVLLGFSYFLFGRKFDMPTILGWNVMAFLFVFLAYNLRHSHIWLRWPGKWAYVFGCPAHHQVHHSCHPDHIDKNFAFMLPVWDVIFGTFCLPETNKDVKFGLGNGEERDYRSVVGLYLVPFRKLWARFAR